jgi:dTDP-4-amino-4,6-dideoxygalactose transaminase
MFEKVLEFEKNISEYFGSPYAVATDSCTHAIELCLRYIRCNNITVPSRTYISIPMTCMKLGLDWTWREEEWFDYYYLGHTNIIDAAVLWGENTYIPETYMCLSFQQKKHLSLGRGGAILLQKKEDYDILKKMTCDGRDLSKPWVEQDISSIGYHYYMTPETAMLGSHKFEQVKDEPAKKWTYLDYPYLPSMSVFEDEKTYKT